MSFFSDNGKMIHIACEAVVFMGLAFHFSQQNKKLMYHVENLSQKLEDVEAMLKKHNNLLVQHNHMLQNTSTKSDMSNKQPTMINKSSVKSINQKKQNVNHAIIEKMQDHNIELSNHDSTSESDDDNTMVRSNILIENKDILINLDGIENMDNMDNEIQSELDELETKEID